MPASSAACIDLHREAIGQTVTDETQSSKVHGISKDRRELGDGALHPGPHSNDWIPHNHPSPLTVKCGWRIPSRLVRLPVRMPMLPVEADLCQPPVDSVEGWRVGLRRPWMPSMSGSLQLRLE
jgi:hypothetical protein